MPATIDLSVYLPATEIPMTEGQPSYMPTTVDLSVPLLAAESPMVEGLAFRHASNGRSQCALTGYRKSNGGGVSLPAFQQR